MTMLLRIIQTTMIAGVVGIGVGVFNEFTATENVRVQKWALRIRPYPESFEQDEELASAFYQIQKFREHDQQAFTSALQAANDVCFFYLQISSGKLEIDPMQDDENILALFNDCYDNLQRLVAAVQKSEQAQFNERERAKVQYEHDKREYNSEMETIRRDFIQQSCANHKSSVPSFDDDDDDDATTKGAATTSDADKAAAEAAASKLRPSRPAPLEPRPITLRVDELSKVTYLAVHRLIRYVNNVRNRAREARQKLIKRQIEADRAKRAQTQSRSTYS